MLIYYDSLTGNVKRFTEKLNRKSKKIEEGLLVNTPFIFITYTTGLGKIPDNSTRFLQNNRHYLKAVASSGNKNFGTYYGMAANLIAREYNVPVLSTFELSGTPTDVEYFIKEVEKIETYRTK